MCICRPLTKHTRNIPNTWIQTETFEYVPAMVPYRSYVALGQIQEANFRVTNPQSHCARDARAGLFAVMWHEAPRAEMCASDQSRVIGTCHRSHINCHWPLTAPSSFKRIETVHTETLLKKRTIHKVRHSRITSASDDSKRVQNKRKTVDQESIATAVSFPGSGGAHQSPLLPPRPGVDLLLTVDVLPPSVMGLLARPMEPSKSLPEQLEHEYHAL